MPTVQCGEVTIYYEEAGTGDPLLFICGLGADLQIWRFQVSELSQSHRMICFDNRGAGWSGAPDEPYSVEGMAADVIALLDHLQIPAASILGWSMGGLIAQSLALSHPDRVKHLLLLGTFAEADGLLRIAINNWVNIQRPNMPYEQVVRHASRWIFSPALADNDAAYEASVQNMTNNPYRQTLHGFVRQAEALVGYKTSRQLAELRMPTSILVGEHDQLGPYLSEQLASQIPGSKLLVLPGAHCGFLEYPKQYK
jgi:3-oxoadipate enol-lactonase